MAKKALLTVDGVHHKVKKGFITDEASVHRKVEKAFMTVGGVYRPCWSTGWEYWGTTNEGLQSARNFPIGTNVGDYVLFGACWLPDPPNDKSTHVDAYNKSLTRFIPQPLGGSRTAAAATNNDKYAVYATGCSPYGSYVNYDQLYYYDASLTKTAASLLDKRICVSNACKFNEFAVFAGGKHGTVYNTLYAFDNSMTRSIYTMSSQRTDSGCSATKDHLIVAGGYTNDYATAYTDSVDSFDRSFTRTVLPVLPVARGGLCSSKTANKAIIRSGWNGAQGTYQETGFAWDNSLTRTDYWCWYRDQRSSHRESYKGMSINFNGWKNIDGTYSGTYGADIEVFDDDLVRTAPGFAPSATPKGIFSSGVGVIGDYILVAGGGGGHSNVTEYFDTVHAFTFY